MSRMTESLIIASAEQRRKKKENISACKKFDAGPAAEVRTQPRRGCLNLEGRMLTGFAQPMPNRRSVTKPNGSIWRRGLRLSLPCAFDVGAPQRFATSAGANSCSVSSMTSAMSAKTSYCSFSEMLPSCIKILKSIFLLLSETVYFTKSPPTAVHRYSKRSQTLPTTAFEK